MNVQIQLQADEFSIRCIAVREQEAPFVEYVFRSKQPGTELGRAIVEATLLNYTILDLLSAKRIHVLPAVNRNVQTYLTEEFGRYQFHYKARHAILSPTTLQFEASLNHESILPTELDGSKCFLGFSGGKDSTLSNDLIKDDFAEVCKFKINFDEDEFDRDFSIAKKVLDERLYTELSTEQLFVDQGMPFYQEDDMHVVFAAPYFTVTNGMPASLAVGIPWDNLNAELYTENEKISEYVLGETQESLAAFQNLLVSFGLVEFSIFSPIATVNSFAVYYAIMSKYGAEYLLSLDSCWHSSQNGGKRCMACNKCQRLTLIYSRLGIRDEGMEESQVADVPLDNLFGSFSVQQLLENGVTDLAEHVYLDQEIKKWDKGYHKKLVTEYGLTAVSNPILSKGGTHHDQCIDP